MLAPTDPDFAGALGLRLVQRRRELLQRSGVTQVALAARAGVSRQSVGLVLAGHHRSRHVEQAIADACGVAREELFPVGAGGGTGAGHEVVAAAAVGARAAPSRDPAVEPPAGPAVAPGARAEPGERVVAAAVAVSPFEERVTAELRRIAEEVFLAMAGQGLATNSAVVRAAAAALRELGAAAPRR